MIRVGVIGGIGSGKSFISKLFKSPVFNADKEVEFLYKNNLECYKKLKKKLPNFVKSFPVSKSQLIKAINHDKKNLKTISSAVANAENNYQYDIDKLVIKEAYCGKQVIMKRFRPRAKGRAAPIIKPYSNLTIILSEQKQNQKEKHGTKG